MNVIAIAMKDRMLLDADDDKEIARRAAAASGVAFSGDADALAVARARLDPHFQRLGDADHALPMAVGTLIHDLSGSVTTRAGHVEFHPPAGLGDLAGAFAIRTRLARTDRRRAFAHWAYVLPRDVQTHHSPANRLPESNRDLVFKVGSRFGTLWLRPCASAREDA